MKSLEYEVIDGQREAINEITCNASVWDVRRAVREISYADKVFDTHYGIVIERMIKEEIEQWIGQS